MARLLVVALVAVCYIACVSAQPPNPNPGPPPGDYYSNARCDCDSYGQGRRWYSGPSGEGGYYSCYECEPVLSPGEIAGIVVGCVVFLILIIIIIIWCFWCGCDCDCDDGRRPHGLRRWDSDDGVYVTRQAVPAVKPQFVQAAPMQTTCVVPPAQPTIQVIKAPNFQPAVIQQQQPQVIQVPNTSATPQITYLS